MNGSYSIGLDQPAIEAQTIKNIVSNTPSRIGDDWCRKVFADILSAVELQYTLQLPHRPINPDTVVVPERGVAMLVSPIDQQPGDVTADLAALAGTIHYAITHELESAGPLGPRALDGYSTALTAAVDRCMSANAVDGPPGIDALRAMLGSERPDSRRGLGDQSLKGRLSLSSIMRTANDLHSSVRTPGVWRLVILMAMVSGGLLMFFMMPSAEIARDGGAYAVLTRPAQEEHAVPDTGPAGTASDDHIDISSEFEKYFGSSGELKNPDDGRGRTADGLRPATQHSRAAPVAVKREQRTTAAIKIKAGPRRSEKKRAAAGVPSIPDAVKLAGEEMAPKRVKQPVPQGQPSAAAPDADVTLGLHVQPWGVVYLDGVEQGVTPPLKRLIVRPGRHAIRITNPRANDRLLEADATHGDVNIAVDFRKHAD